MAAGIRNIEIEQGSTFAMTIYYKDSAGDPIDLTGYSGRGQVRYAAQDAAAAASFSVTIPDPTNGVINVELTADQSAGIVLTGRSYSEKSVLYYDIEIYIGSEAKRLLQGSATISPEITK